MNETTPDTLELQHHQYEAAGGTEFFVSIEDPDQGLLVGFVRLRFPANPTRQELFDAAIVRELHVYGSEVGFGDDPLERASVGEENSPDVGFQHQGFGKRLMREAERLTADGGFEKLAVLSGIGAREYYREQLNYRRDGPYMSTRL